MAEHTTYVSILPESFTTEPYPAGMHSKQLFKDRAFDKYLEWKAKRSRSTEKKND